MELPELSDNLTLESLERNGFSLLQLKDGFRYGTDTTLLAWYAASYIKRGSVKNKNKIVRALELGSNVGACSLLFAARFLDILNTELKADGNLKAEDMADYLHLDSVEINTPSYEVLCRNIDNNGLCNIVAPHNCDLRDLPKAVRDLQYDIVFFNPPFFSRQNGPEAQAHADSMNARLNGRFEENGNLNDFVEAAAKRVIPDGGYVVMIMQGGRLQDALASFRDNKLSPVSLMNIHPFVDKNASMFLLAGRRTSKKTDFKIQPPLILNTKNDASGDIMSSDAINRIYNEVHSNCFI
ncbi:MAG: hypothetical protein MJ153_04460 [Clostridia bacterium]|nr:hypothetical protein [Clostridia bacterium]